MGCLTSRRELFDAEIDGHAQESGGREVGVERKRMPDALRPHRGEAGGIHEAERVIAIALEQGIGPPFQGVVDEDPFEARCLVERLQKTATGRVAARWVSART